MKWFTIVAWKKSSIKKSQPRTLLWKQSVLVRSSLPESAMHAQTLNVSLNYTFFLSLCNIWDGFLIGNFLPHKTNSTSAVGVLFNVFCAKVVKNIASTFMKFNMIFICESRTNSAFDKCVLCTHYTHRTHMEKWWSLANKPGYRIMVHLSNVLCVAHAYHIHILIWFEPYTNERCMDDTAQHITQINDW